MKTFMRAQLAPWHSAVEIYIGDRDGGTRVSEIKMERVDEAIVASPSFIMNMEVSQTLMDDLWQCGLRPTDGAGTAGSMRATEKHLEDMRKIAFAKLKIT